MAGKLFHCLTPNGIVLIKDLSDTPAQAGVFGVTPHHRLPCSGYVRDGKPKREKSVMAMRQLFLRFSAPAGANDTYDTRQADQLVRIFDF